MVLIHTNQDIDATRHIRDFDAKKYPPMWEGECGGFIIIMCGYLMLFINKVNTCVKNLCNHNTNQNICFIKHGSVFVSASRVVKFR